MKIGPRNPRVTASTDNGINLRYRSDSFLAPKQSSLLQNDTKGAATVYVIDGDLTVHDSIRWNLESAKVRVVYCSTPESFLRSYVAGKDPACIVLDVRLPDCTGPDLQERLLAQGIEVPTIFVSACTEIATAVRVMKRGAFDFVAKPFELHDLTQRILDALVKDQERLKNRESRTRLELRLRQLSEREREVMDLVVTGLSSRQIAARLFITRKTVECHRLRIMKKMAATNVAQLIYQLYSIGSLHVRQMATASAR
jgi:RNA polymerase sigma factor (sigma-70 family)